MGLFSRKSRPAVEVLARARAAWDTGPLESSSQCTGLVTAYSGGLEARSDQDGNANIEWECFKNFGFAEEDYKIILNAGAPFFWFFMIDCEDAEDRAGWRQLLWDQGVTENK